MKAKLFRADPHYLDILHSFTVHDTLMALGYYLVILIVYYCTGSIMARTGKYYGVFANIALMQIPVMICRKMSSIGLCKRNLKRSLLVSGMIGILFLLISTIIPGISSGAKLLPLKKIASNVIYFFVVIALSEEISFRGFIQPRLYPLVKREWLAVLFGGTRNDCCSILAPVHSKRPIPVLLAPGFYYAVPAIREYIRKHGASWPCGFERGHICLNGCIMGGCSSKEKRSHEKHINKLS